MPADTVTAGAPLPAAVAAAQVVSLGWAQAAGNPLTQAALAEIRAAVAQDTADGLAFTDAVGYRHWPAVGRRSPALLRMLEDAELGRLAADAAGSPDIWLGTMEVIAADGSERWRRDGADVLAATASSQFRPSLSVLLPLDASARFDVQHGSHRLRTAAGAAGDPRDHESVPVRPDGLLLVGAGCRHRLRGGHFLHLRFIRGWMKPDVLLAEALGGAASGLGPRGRRWCGADIGLPTSVAEFLSVEEDALTGGLSQRKGSGI